MDRPELSIVIAAHNAASTLPYCLQALCPQTGDDVEVIVVDDGSDDDTAAIAEDHPVRVERLPRRRGVAAARNRGAALARGPVLFFLDADTAPPPGLVDRARRLMAQPDLDAVFGSYDDEPAAPTLVSQFKNLAHHYFHQRSSGPASTFWGACGLVRKDLFTMVGGFDEERFGIPSIEDVELGDRLHERGARIRLEPELQVKHLKRWTLASLVRTDIAHRAIPWTLMSLSRKRLPRNLNFSLEQRLAAALAVALLLAPILVSLRPLIWPVLPVLLVLAILINRGLFAVFYRRGGLRLAVAGFVLQQLYYCYALLGLAAGIVLHLARRPSLRPGPRSELP